MQSSNLNFLSIITFIGILSQFWKNKKQDELGTLNLIFRIEKINRNELKLKLKGKEVLFET